MNELEIERQRAANLWQPFARKFEPIGKAIQLNASPSLDFSEIGGLAEPKEEMLTYACAATDPEVYERWGTAPPSGLLLMGPPESGKSMLAEALARNTDTSFLCVRIPRLVLQVFHTSGSAGPFLQGWTETLEEMPRLTVFFREVEFKHVESLMGRRPDLPVAPSMDFLLELIDRTMAIESVLVLGSSSHPRTLSPIFLEPGRFERVVWVQPEVPDDLVAALGIHAGRAEQRAGRSLFASVDWFEVVKHNESATVGEWVRVMNAVLRRKARCDAASEDPEGVSTQDLLAELARLERSAKEFPARPGRYL